MDEKELQELIQKMLDEHKKGLLKSDEFIKSLSELIFKTISEQLQLGDLETLKKNVKTLTDEIKTLRAGTLADGNVKILDPLYDGCWKSAEMAKDFGLYVLASVCGSKKSADLLKAKGYKVEKDMGSDDLTAGGILVPQQMLDGLIMLIGQYGVYRRNALVVPMTTDSATGMRLDSGLTVYCVAEGVTPTKSDAGFSSIGLSAKEWLTYTLIDNTLTEDAAIMVGNLVGELIAVAFAEKEDEIGFMGTGIATHFGYKGIKGKFSDLSTPAGVIEASGDTWGEIVLKDLLKVQGKVHSKARDPKWFVSRMFYYEVMCNLMLSAGGVYAEEIQKNNVARSKTALGDPVEFVHAMPAATAVSQLCAFYGDLKRGAMLGERRQTTIAQSEHYKFAERQLTVLGSERVAVTVYGCGDDTNAGTITALKTAAS